MLPVDPVECALAVIGLKPVISKEVEKVTAGKVTEMRDLPKRIYREAKDIMQGQRYKVPNEVVNYKRMLHDLTEEYTDGQLMEMVQKFPPEMHALTSQFLVKAQQVVQLLRALFPIQTKQTLLGPENLPPSVLALRRFVTTFEVLDEPTKLLAHIACGSLLKSQADAAKQVYPTLTRAIEDALTEAAIDERTKLKSYLVPPKVARAMAVWTGQPLITPQLQQRLQSNFETQKQQQQAEAPTPQGQSGTSSSVAAKAALTSTQHSLFPQQTSKAT